MQGWWSRSYLHGIHHYGPQTSQALENDKLHHNQSSSNPVVAMCQVQQFLWYRWINVVSDTWYAWMFCFPLLSKVWITKSLQAWNGQQYTFTVLTQGVLNLSTLCHTMVRSLDHLVIPQKITLIRLHQWWHANWIRWAGSGQYNGDLESYMCSRG